MAERPVRAAEARTGHAHDAAPHHDEERREQRQVDERAISSAGDHSSRVEPVRRELTRASGVLGPLHAIERASLALRRPSRAGRSARHRWLASHGGRRRTLVDETGRCGGRADSFLDDRSDDDHALTRDEGFDAVAEPDLRRRFRDDPVHPYATPAARSGRDRAGLAQAHGPQPLIDARRRGGLRQAGSAGTRPRSRTGARRGAPVPVARRRGARGYPGRSRAA